MIDILEGTRPCPAPKGGIVTDYLLPTRIVVEKDVENAKLLLNARPRQAMLGDSIPYAKIHKGGYIILDFGREIQGGADITLHAFGGSRMRIVFGESVSEAMSEIGVKNATNDHAIRDTVIDVTYWQHLRTWNTGYRFLKLEAVEDDLLIAGVQATFEHRVLHQRGYFKCNDERLNKIWEVGLYTVFLNMQEYIWDGIKRDRLVWIGDMHPETSTIFATYGAVDVVRDSLDLSRDNTADNEWMGTIPSYNVWWMRIHYDHYIETGDIDYLNEQRDKIILYLKRFIAKTDLGDTPNNDMSHYVDWSSHLTEYEEAGYQAMMVQCFVYGAKLCRIFGEETLATECDRCADIYRAQNHEYMGNKQVSAMLSLFDVVDAKAVSEQVLSVGGADGMSTFWGYYVLLALAKAGDYATALDMIKTYWGAMLDLGATTFWEDFDMSWVGAARIDEVVPEGAIDVHGDYGKHCYKNFRHSLCHGWASGPTAYLSKVVLGIIPLEPGYSKIKIEPHLDGLTYAEGAYPTPHGDIYVKHTVIDGSVKTEYKLPDGVEIIG